MIFQSLINLYDRLYPEGKVPEPGFSEEDIGFVVTLDKNGNMVGQPEDLRNRVNANVFEFKTSFVPYTNQVNVRSSSAAKVANFMVDKADYIFGMSGKSEKKIHHRSFIDLIDEVCGNCADEGVLAVRRFLQKWSPASSPDLQYWDEMCGTHGKWVAFRLQGEHQFIHERQNVKRLWQEYYDNLKHPSGISLLDGKPHDLQEQFAQFKFGSGASLVSFNERAYESYNKKGAQNAPLSVKAEFKSSAALKFLFRNRNQRLRIGDATTVFWTNRESPMENLFGQIINPSYENDEQIVAVQKFLENARDGTIPNAIGASVQFYILGLALNKARLALRFWYSCTVEELVLRIQDHFENLEMERESENDIPFPGIWHLLKETARETKMISPILGGALTRAILTGTDYPMNLYQGVLNRIKTDGRVSYLRSSIIKAVLRRNYNKEIPMTLDTQRYDPPYLLGRLFAVLEKAQLDAVGRVNSTIKDRFFSAASATPGSVFPRLLRLSQHHIDKAEFGHLSDRRISEIMEIIQDFPAHMNMQEQGIFAIGYYHQKNELWRKKNTETNQGEGENNNE